MSTLITLMTENIGQMKEESADAEIQRMNKQTGKLWRKDYLVFMFVED